MLVYSLGMTLYWAVDFQVPQNQVEPDIFQTRIADISQLWWKSVFLVFIYFCSQPVQLSDHLNSVLLSMCEDIAHRRLNLNSILEACESQHKASILPSPTKVIKRLAEEVFREPVSGEFSSNLTLFSCDRWFIVLFFSSSWTKSLTATVTFPWVAEARWSERGFMVRMHVRLMIINLWIHPLYRLGTERPMQKCDYLVHPVIMEQHNLKHYKSFHPKT